MKSGALPYSHVLASKTCRDRVSHHVITLGLTRPDSGCNVEVAAQLCRFGKALG